MSTSIDANLSANEYSTQVVRTRRGLAETHVHFSDGRIVIVSADRQVTHTWWGNGWAPMPVVAAALAAAQDAP